MLGKEFMLLNHTSIIVSSASLFVFITDSVSSQHLLKTPATPVMPIPSIMSLVSLNGTCHRWLNYHILWRRQKLKIFDCPQIYHMFHKWNLVVGWTDPLWCFQHEALFEGNSKINVNYFCSSLINENVHWMPITKSNNVAHLKKKPPLPVSTVKATCKAIILEVSELMFSY